MRSKLLILMLIVAVAAGVHTRSELRTPYGSATSPVVVEIPPGIGTRDVLRLLLDRNVIGNDHVALAYLFYMGEQGRLQAGEYMFDRPMTTPEVLSKIVRGQVYLHRFTVPEGLTLAETAAEWERQKFGTATDFIAAASAAVELVRKLDAKATSVEGYLFPETYSFPSRTTAAQAINAMVNRFQTVIEDLKKNVPLEKWPLNLRDTTILASLIETEAAHADERPLVSSVYLNRLQRRILLQCDPTVIYALEQAGKYRGRLLLVDLKFNSPYNTYVYPGLPPGPIASAGYASLLAAVQPASTKYLYFVRAPEGKHTFSETLAAHNRAVAAYRAMMRQQRPRG